MEIILSIKLSVDKLVEIDKFLDDQKVTLLSADRRARIEYEDQIKLFIDTLDEKEKSLTGKANKRRLSNLIKKWNILLGEEMPLAKIPRYRQLAVSDLRSNQIWKTAMSVNWMKQIQELLYHSKTSRKLHPDFIQPTKSKNPEVAKIIKLMQALD